VDRTICEHIPVTNNALVNFSVLLKASVRSRNLVVMPLLIVAIVSPPTKSSTELIRIKMLLFFWEAGRMMCPDEPSRHPVSHIGKMRYTPVDVVPRQPAAAALSECRLDVGIELTKVVECRGSTDRVKKAVGQFRRVP
jgi:hypothetical protein